MDREEISNSIEYTVDLYKKKQMFKPVTSRIKDYSFYSFDVETYGRNNEFYIGGVIDDKERFHLFFDFEECVNFFRKIKYRNVLVAVTNLGFDFSVLFKNSKYFNDCEFLVNKGRFICVTLKGVYGKIRFVDSLNYGGLSVAKMGKILGIPKLDKPLALGHIPKSKAELDELIIYNKRDCEVTYKFMVYLQKIINTCGGQLGLTISSSAMDIFSRVFLLDEVLKEDVSTGLTLKPKIFKAYYGGRTEVFKRGLIKDYNYFDINSLYPSVMLYKFPNPNSVKYQYAEDRGLLKFEGVSYFEIFIPDTDYPPLPFRNPKLIFPVGRIKGYYTHVEIRRVLELFPSSYLNKMCDTVYYTKCEYYFKDYIEFMYNKRLEAKSVNSSMEVFYKLLMNSLYGRFALREITKTDFFIANDLNVVKNKVKGLKSNSNFKLRVDDISFVTSSEVFDGKNSFPIWSVYVTAYSRLLMYDYIRELEPVYTDTDSLICKGVIPESKDLGKMKLECVISEGLVIKPKVYFFNDVVKLKGVRLPSKDDEDYLVKIEDLKRSVIKGEFIYYEKFIKMKESIIQGLFVNEIVNVEKKIDLEDDKRFWFGKKFNPCELQSSKPLRVCEW